MGPIVTAAIVGGALAFDNRSSLRLLVSQPICGGLLAGLALGDWRAGFTAGALLQALFLGAVPVRGLRLPDLPVGGAVAAVLAVLVPRSAGSDPGARGLSLACALGGGLLAAAAMQRLYGWWERRAHVLDGAAGRAIDAGRFGAASAIHFSTFAIHFAGGFLAAGAAAAAAPAIGAGVEAAAGAWSEPLGSLRTLLPFVGAGALLFLNRARVRLALFIAGFACVFIVLLFAG